jgi:DNA primase
MKGRLREFWETRPITSKKQKTKFKLMSHFSLDDSPTRDSSRLVNSVKTANLSKKMEFYQEEFNHSPAEIYLANRGICALTAAAAGCGYAQNWKHWEKIGERWSLEGTDRRVVFPIYDQNEHLVALHGRAVDEKFYGSAKITRGDKSGGLFLSDAKVLEQKVIAICEGAIDALTLGMCGIPSVAMTGTTPPQWLYKKMGFRRVLIATDADEAGDRAAMRLKSELAARGAKILRLRPQYKKDWGEVLETNGIAEMGNLLKGFQADLSDEERFEESLKIAYSGRKEAAEFTAELIECPRLRTSLLYRLKVQMSQGV